jgi:hypothetical protein
MSTLYEKKTGFLSVIADGVSDYHRAFNGLHVRIKSKRLEDG